MYVLAARQIQGNIRGAHRNNTRQKPPGKLINSNGWRRIPCQRKTNHRQSINPLMRPRARKYAYVYSKCSMYTEFTRCCILVYHRIDYRILDQFLITSLRPSRELKLSEIVCRNSSSVLGSILTIPHFVQTASHTSSPSK